jgi:hypothetical protein
MSGYRVDPCEADAARKQVFFAIPRMGATPTLAQHLSPATDVTRRHLPGRLNAILSYYVSDLPEGTRISPNHTVSMVVRRHLTCLGRARHPYAHDS